MRMIRYRGQTLLFFYIIVFLLIVTSPFWIWIIKDSKPLDVLIVDKTVPDESYREHEGLVWLLNNEKYVKKGQQPYSIEEDYIGFKLGANKTYKKESLPTNLNEYELIYLTDLYGVYREEFEKTNETGKRSEQIYGGLTNDEVKLLEQNLFKGRKTLVAEFNTFASPTEEEAKEKISNLLNLSWSGWIGRYFPELESKEVPVWVKENYEKIQGKWNFKGEGIVLVDRNDFIVVLSGKELEAQSSIPVFNVTKKGKQLFDIEKNTQYSYWFDIVEARNNNEVLATYKLPVTASGKEKLTQFDIPIQFPAVIHHQNRKYASYYFAGDFADEPEVPAIYQSNLISFWKKNITAEPSFYWEAYVPMMKKILSSGLQSKYDDKELVEIHDTNGIKTNSLTTKSTIQVMKNGKWEDLLVKGVNIGIAKPGYFPGQTAISKAEYARWFKAIGAMNANTVRIYTLHPPQFYEAFYEYNQTAKKPLYLLHGVWVNEEKLVSSQNAFSNETTEDFKKEITKVVDVIHGSAEIPEEGGHASGKYTRDISPYVLGLLIGIEWDPEAVLHTNEKNPAQSFYNGQFFQTKDAAPFESWLAQMLDFTTQYETDRYHWQHSVSFSNWVTTDLLVHPAEPLANEDLVSVNPNHILSTDRFQAGLFASYHIYPYYPDVLNLDETYKNYQDFGGKKNNYAGYLHQLIQAHQLPVLVAEFGVPASRGLTHKNVHGMNQGFLSEQDQGLINQRLFKSIISEGYAGGIVFSWQDEWFKRTWNTMDYDDSDRRPYWSNLQTNEQHFGLLSFDPGKQGKAMAVDGNTGDWLKNGAKPIYQDQSKDAVINKVYVHSDEANVYVRLDYNKPIDWKSQSSYLLLDTIANQGQYKVPLNETKQVETNYGVDFLVNLQGEKNSNILVDSYYDPFYYQYGYQLQMIQEIAGVNVKNNGLFHPIRLALNKLQVPEKEKSYETGRLLFGNGNPDSEQYQSLTDVSISKDQKVLELRIPWQLINVKDPSQKLIMSDVWKNGLKGKEKIVGIKIAVVTTEKDKLNKTLPKMNAGVLDEKDVFLYEWKEWDQPNFHERLKDSYYIMKETFGTSGK
ncbi:hypothetical protein [Neobacillus sp. LXY-4]|uniref:hypothetical protein n=1 Tax=Neobacillus sp. LXY-4 TaxID=3379826 RepID=UPI003EDFDEC6